MSSREVSEVIKMAMDSEPSNTSSYRKQRSRSPSPSRSSHSRHYHSRRRSRSGSRSRSRRHKKRSRSRSRSRDRHSRRHRSRSKSRSRRERTENYSKSSSSRSSKRVQDERGKKCNDDVDMNMPLPPEPPKISPVKHTQSHKNSSENEDDDYYNYNVDEEPIDKERIHREMEEKLREALAREGKVYPPKKPEASHPVFANDGSFIEIFKKMQEQAAASTIPLSTAAPLAANALLPPTLLGAATPATAPYVAATATGRSAPAPPLVGRRRGGKILKTGVVAKQRVKADGSNSDPKDFWALYLAEVNKYKNTACETETGNRPLVK